MKTLLVPLDERPCNYTFPQRIATTNPTIDLLVPSLSILGHKKQPAHLHALDQYLYQNIKHVDNLILSIDMLVYGGLIPSRLHHFQYLEASYRLKIIHRLKELNPQLKIYAFTCIMRSPSYNSSEEEPDYYEQYGYALYRRAYLLDYQKRHGLSEDESEELSQIIIPQDIIVDYETRRHLNTDINIEVIQYLEKGDIDFLVIPQDDSSPYGYTAISQKSVINEIKKKHLDSKVMVYPGADEVAMSLMTRAYHDYQQMKPKVYPFYASVLGPMIIPKYEDRPMFESLKSHIRVCHAQLVDKPEDADFILAINSPGKIMQEAFVSEEERDVSYTSYRELLTFVDKIKDYITQGFQVAICDSAYSNGGDYQLLQFLDDCDLLEQLSSYAGWNTNCNTLGTTLSQAMLGQNNLVDNLCYRIIEDVFYQTLVRKSMIDNDLKELGLSYYDFKDQQEQVEKRIQQQLQTYYNSLKISQMYPVVIEKINMPWQRMFEIGIKIKVDKDA